MAGGYPWTSDWASQLLREFANGSLSINIDVPSVAVTKPSVGNAIAAFITKLDTTSTSITPIQLINLLKHAFESVVTPRTPANELHELAEVRDTIISIIGDNWVNYGPISAIVAATFVTTTGYKSGGYGGQSVDDILKAAKYKAPEVNLSAEMSGFSSTPPTVNDAFGNPEEILFASIAKVLKTMLTTQEKTIPLYVVSSLSDSSPMTMGIKENIRANLPIFVKMFEMIRKDCEIIGNLLTIGIDVSDALLGGGIGYRAELLDVHGQVLSSNSVSSSNAPFTGVNAINYMSRLLNKISQSCGAIIDSADDVMREVFDDPKYLEVKENSISKYRTEYNVDPFMPLSTMLTQLNPTFDRKNLTFSTPESRVFEFNYGTRLLLGKPKVLPKLDQMNGVREIVESYNLVAASDKKISLDTTTKSSLMIIQLARWLVDLAIYVPITSNNQMIVQLGPDSIYQASPATTLDAALNLTTGTNKRQSIAQLSEWVTQRGGGNLNKNPILNREKMQIMNIIDMNVNPINLNALRREIPLINMLNYSMTFDAFVKEQLKKSAPAMTVVYHSPPRVASKEDMLLALALDPYRQKIDTAEWDRMFDCYSDNSAGLLGFTGHDAFAVDQVFRKSLLYSELNKDSNGAPPNERRGLFDRRTGTNKPRNDLIDRIPQSAVNKATLDELGLLGMARHDTTFIRNILFISMCHRMMRARMNKEMTKITFPVVSGPAITSRDIDNEDMWEDRYMTRESWGQAS